MSFLNEPQFRPLEFSETILALACFQLLRCPVLIGTMSSVTPVPHLPRTIQVFPGLWLLLSFPQWDYAGLGWLGGGFDSRLGFPADHIRNGSLWFLHKFCSFISTLALIRPSRETRREILCCRLLIFSLWYCFQQPAAPRCRHCQCLVFSPFN